MEVKPFCLNVLLILRCVRHRNRRSRIKLFISTVKAISPTFVGINHEDIKAPECFAIEQSLSEQLNIPFFHDDQHGTAIVVAAGLLNALEFATKKT